MAIHYCNLNPWEVETARGGDHKFRDILHYIVSEARLSSSRLGEKEKESVRLPATVLLYKSFIVEVKCCVNNESCRTVACSKLLER